MSLRVAIVVLATAFMLAVQGPALVQPWLPYGYTGVVLGSDYVVRVVDPGSPAAAAGLRAGDRMTRDGLDLKTKVLLAQYRIVPPGYAVSMTVERAGAISRHDFVAVPRVAHLTAAQSLVDALSSLAYPVFALTGALLALLRPSLMTTSLLVFCLGYGSSSATASFWFLPQPLFLALTYLNSVVSGSWSDFPILFFVLLFPNHTLTGWRLRAATIGLIATVLAFFYVVALQTLVLYGPLPNVIVLWTLPGELVFIAALIVLVKTQVRASAQERQRLKWATLGMGFAFAALFINAFGYTMGAPELLVTGANAATLVMPAALAYAILRHRLIDVSFALNRAILYAATTTALLALMGFLDWLVGRLVSERHLTDAIEATVAIGLGFLLNRLHQALEAFVDRVLFRARFRTETYLRRVASALQFAGSSRSVDETLANEPASALGLTSAAVFRRLDGQDGYARVSASGWDGAIVHLDADDALVRFLAAERDVVWLEDARRRIAHGPKGELAPVLSVPVVSRNELVAFVLYGAHVNGTQLDPEEVDLLKALARTAAAAYDHVEVAELRARLATNASAHASATA